MKVSIVYETKNILGEGPLWHQKQNKIFWVDGEMGELYRFDPASSAVCKWELPEPIGSFCFRKKGGLVLALGSGFCFFDLQTSTLTRIPSPDERTLGNRFNDGKCDRQGRFWAGTLDGVQTDFKGSLYRLDPNLSWSSMESKIGISNGICWSPDNRTMYFSDSLASTIYAYDFDLESGNISNRRIFAQTTEPGVVPDGATVDSEGFIWSAHWGGWRVIRYSPEGKVDQVIELPVEKPTSCTFGGDRFDELFITSARFGIDDEALATQPLAGSLFSIKPGVIGLPEPFFEG